MGKSVKTITTSVVIDQYLVWDKRVIIMSTMCIIKKYHLHNSGVLYGVSSWNTGRSITFSLQHAVQSYCPIARNRTNDYKQSMQYDTSSYYKKQRGVTLVVPVHSVRVRVS